MRCSFSAWTTIAHPKGPRPMLTAEQLKQLAGLKDQGILTEDEFAAQKIKILGS